jgi:pimeloyl-ACP methyl ester carboxylesterase
MQPLLRERGHELFTPTYTGWGRVIASRDVELETHRRHSGVLVFEDLRNVILIAHSYGGMVATGVADRAPERLAQLVYLDAFVPRDGQCQFDLQSAETRGRMHEAARTVGDGWRVPPNPVPPDTSEADVAWVTPGA